MPASDGGDKGTCSHVAPQLLFPEEFDKVSKQADVYAFGVAVYEVLVGRTPFSDEGRGMIEIALLIMEGKRASKPENADDIGLGRGTWEFVQRCWHQDGSHDGRQHSERERRGNSNRRDNGL